MAKISLKNKNGYKWTYCSLGGVIRVNIASGEDIAHLGELDHKLWTVLSMPTKNLEFDTKTLAYLDKDGDGHIKVAEVVDAANMLCATLKNRDNILKGADTISLDEINDQTAEGKTLADALKLIKKNNNNDSISLESLSKSFEALKEKHAKARETAEATAARNDIRPYGDNTDAIIAAYEALSGKLADYFKRCALIAFNEACQESLDTTAVAVANIAQKDLTTCTSDIATYPLARPTAEGTLPASTKGINPEYQSAYSTLLTTATTPGASVLTKADFDNIGTRIAAYKTAIEEQIAADIVGHDDEETAMYEAITTVDRFLHIYKNFYQLLRNYVMFSDFYSLSKPAVFQAGRLYLDQRCCELCVIIEDMSQHADMSGLSGMFIIYCTCVNKTIGKTLNIAAVLTRGDVDMLRVGKNGIFYDRAGNHYDATITKIVDNPISVRQAFWSPYKKLFNWCTEKLNKAVSEKESESMNNLTTQAESTQEQAQSDMTEGKKATTPNFDIARFAGIFAAIGLALGYIGGFLIKVGTGFIKLGYWMPLGIFCILMLISGPSMLIAWLKLRKRDLGPVLNANGWAINAKAIVNSKFGATLTSIAKYPRLNIKDPYADKGWPWYVHLTLVLITLAAITAAVYFILLHYGQIDPLF